MPRVVRAPRNSVRDRPARWRMLLRRARRLLRPAAWLAFAGCIALLGVVIVHSAAPGGTLATMRERLGGITAFAGLRVNNVVIEGRANTPEPLLRAALGVSMGDPILGFSVEQARLRIESLAWVDQATVERRLPGTIVVQLVERRPFAVWQNQGKFTVVDRAGKDVGNQDLANFHQLPLIVGPGAPAAAAPLIDALTDRPALNKRVTALVRVGDRRWNLVLSNGVGVLLPEGHELLAIDRLMQLQQDHALLDRPLQLVDLRLPDRLVIRPRPDPNADAATTTKKPT
jgi:cell division protein FtsQ